MTQEPRAISGLMAIFPSLEAFAQFSANSDHQDMIRSIVAYAVRHQIIDRPDRSELREFIGRHSRSGDQRTPPKHLTFEDLLNQKNELLNLSISVRALTERVNALLKEHRLGLPKVSNSMLTRLKREPADTIHKQNILRSLAFWIGHERASIGPQWNYETLNSLCRDNKTLVHHKSGVRIGFAVYSRGEVIDHEIMLWLKRNLKDYIDHAMDHFAYGRWGKVKAHDITTLLVDFPEEDTLIEPASYRLCLRGAVSLAHQISIRWALSKYCSKNRFLSIGIGVGGFANLDNYLLPLLNAKLPGDPVIRLTGYARQCLLINDIRVLLCNQPTESTLFNGETLNIWWLVGLWSTIYFDFVPDLLNDPILQSSASSVDDLTQLLLSAERQKKGPAEDTRPNAIQTFFRFPHNSLLGIEIAKTLYFRRRFWEAIDVLQVVLSLDPYLLNARTLRMVLVRNLAVESTEFIDATVLFKEARQEARYIQKNCSFHTEDFYCEYAVCHLAEAMLTVKRMRQGQGKIQGAAPAEELKTVVFQHLEKAESLFGMGRIVSPTGIRAGYLQNSVKVLQAILQHDPMIFSDPSIPIDSMSEIIQRPSRALQLQGGYWRQELSPEDAIEFMEAQYLNDVKTHDDSISLQAYRPTSYFCTAVAWWDFFQIRSVATTKRTVQILRGARDIAASVAPKDVCIYSFIRTFGEMMPADQFIDAIDRSIKMIEEYAGPDLYRRDEEDILEPRGRLSSMLMTLNL